MIKQLVTALADLGLLTMTRKDYKKLEQKRKIKMHVHQQTYTEQEVVGGFIAVLFITFMCLLGIFI